MSEPSGPTYSVALRLQRTTTEYAFVSVPLTADLITAKPDGTGEIDVERMVQRAVEMGQVPGVSWEKEEQYVKPHPIQMMQTDLGLT